MDAILAEISPVDADLLADKIVTGTVERDVDATVIADVTVENRHRPVVEDRTTDADVIPLNHPVPLHLRQDHRDRLMKTADGNDLSDKKDQSTMPWSSFSLTSYTSIPARQASPGNCTG